jgi:hypothetical protein
MKTGKNKNNNAQNIIIKFIADQANKTNDELKECLSELEKIRKEAALSQK